MGLKHLFLVCIQVLIAINVTVGQLLPVITVPAFTNCTQFSNSRNLWLTYTYNNVPSKYCYLYPTYYSYSYSMSWHGADEMCRYSNGTLVSLHDRVTNYIISHPLKLPLTMYSYGVYWIGLNSLNTRRGLYRWSDGTPTQFNNFATTNSVNDPVPANVKDQGRCVSMRTVAQNSYYKNYFKNTGQWFRDDCSTSHKYICERRIDSTPPPTPPPPPKGGCPDGWYKTDQKCIRYFPQPLTFAAAKNKCSQQSNGQNTGELLTVHSQTEQNFLTTLVATGIKPSYIGLIRQSIKTAWKWSDDTTFDYGNFGMETNQAYNEARLCMIMTTDASQPGRWKRIFCNETHPFICQVFKDSSSSKGIDLLSKKCNISGFGNFIQYRKSCYSIIDLPSTKLGYLDAEDHCKNVGSSAGGSVVGHLVSIVDYFEEAFIKYYLEQKGKTDTYLIGLQSKANPDTNDTQLFEWSDNWPVYYTNWMYTEPKIPKISTDQCAAHVNKQKNQYILGAWKTVSCSTPYSYICKATKTPAPNVNSGQLNGVCPKINGNNDQSLAWVNLHKGLPNCYWFSTDRRGGGSGYQSWSDASFHCRRRNGTLVSIHSKHEQSVLLGRLKRYDYMTEIWLGLSKNPEGDLVWEDSSPVDFTNWAPGERFANSSGLNDDSGNACVEMAWDLKWKQVACNGQKRNYFVCQTKKLFNSSVQSSPSSKGGKTAGIVIGVLLGIGALIAIGIYVLRRSNMKVPSAPAFENPLSRNQSGSHIKPQQFHNNNESSSSDLTHTANENPFANKSFE